MARAVVGRGHADDSAELRQRRRDLKLFLDDNDGGNAADGHGGRVAARMLVPRRRCDRNPPRPFYPGAFPAPLDAALRRSPARGGPIAQGDHQSSTIVLPSNTSAMRARVARVVSSGSASAAKQPCAIISWFGSGGLL